MKNAITASLIDFFYTIEDTLSLSDKIKIIKNFEHPEILKQILKIVYSPFLIPIKFIEPTTYSRKLHPKADVRLHKFLQVVTDYHFDNKEIDPLFFEKYFKCNITMDEFLIYKRILSRKISIGINLDIVNKVYKNLISTPSKFMSFGDYSPSLQYKFPLIAEPIFDGVRIKCLASPTESFSFDYYYLKYDKILKPVLQELQKIAIKINNVVELDGVLFHSTWAETNYLVSSDNEELLPAAENLIYYISDFIVKGKETIPLEKRKEKVLKFVKKSKAKVKALPWKYVSSHKAMIQSNKKALKNNFPGIMLKDPGSPYEYKKSSYWMELRNTNSLLGTIISILPGQGLSCFKCSCVVIQPKQGTPIAVKNMTTQQREFLWAKRNELLGQYCEVLMKPSKEGLHDPTFLRVRPTV